MSLILLNISTKSIFSEADKCANHMNEHNLFFRKIAQNDSIFIFSQISLQRYCIILENYG